MKNFVNIIKKVFVYLLKVIYILPLFLFGAWLIQMVYFPQSESKEAIAVFKPMAGEGIFRKILKQTGPIPPGHFHMIDEHISQTEPYQPLCITCHGTYSHIKEKKVRSLLNFHTGFMACTVCHVRNDRVDKNFSFIWVDRHSGLTSMRVSGGYGKYPAKIFPVKIDAKGQKEILHPVSEKSAREFLKLKDQFTPDQMAQAKIKLHEGISTKPVFCTECHKKGGYFDFIKLGFTQNRVDHLTSTEIASMVENYETFYLPEVIDFGGGRRGF